MITGASSGIGLELSHVHASHGHDLVLVARSEGRLRELKEEVEREHGIRAMVRPADLSEAGAPEKIRRETAEQDIEIEYLVNNAGIGDSGPFHRSDWAKQSDMIRINMHALTHLTRLYLPGMVERESGRVLNVASTAAFYPGPLMSVYYATKNYVLAFSEALAGELSESPVTVTALCPGPTKSGFQSTADIHDTPLVRLSPLAGAREVARFGYRQMMKGKPVAVPGLMNKISVQLSRISPRSLTRKFVRKLQETR